ncbi:MAG: ribosome-binding factor A [Chloroflexi bacterium RBG_16_68_14]|nr:MAG: ribosome-binding factor A [Chloroflexi bacterium RBG_16_68_14]
MTRRTERINDLLREEISDLLRREVKDPRVGGLVTITEVDVSPDLRQAKVFVSVLGSEEEKTSTFQALEAASHFLRRELRKRLTIRRMPELTFHPDDSLERGARILSLLDQAREDRSP